MLAVLGVSEFTATLIGAAIGGVIAAAAGAAAGVITARLQAKRTEEVALQLRRREREEQALWEIVRRASELLELLRNPNEIIAAAVNENVLTTLDFREARRLLGELHGRWRVEVGPTIRSDPLVRLYTEVQTASDLLSDKQAETPQPLIHALERLLEESRRELGVTG